MFNSYVKLPEGIWFQIVKLDVLIFGFTPSPHPQLIGNSPPSAWQLWPTEGAIGEMSHGHRGLPN